jgi:hypothetical protein
MSYRDRPLGIECTHAALHSKVRVLLVARGSVPPLCRVGWLASYGC